MAALRDLKYMLEMPSEDANIARFLHNHLNLKADNPSDLAILMDAQFLSEYPSKSRLELSDFIGEGGRNSREDIRQTR